MHLLGEQLILAFLLGPVCGFIYCVWNCGIISHKLVWKCDQPHDFLHALLPAFWQMLLARPKANVPANFMFNNTNCEAALLLVDLWCLCLRPNGDGQKPELESFSSEVCLSWQGAFFRPSNESHKRGV